MSEWTIVIKVKDLLFKPGTLCSKWADVSPESFWRYETKQELLSMQICQLPLKYIWLQSGGTVKGLVDIATVLASSKLGSNCELVVFSNIKMNFFICKDSMIQNVILDTI